MLALVVLGAVTKYQKEPPKGRQIHFAHCFRQLSPRLLGLMHLGKMSQCGENVAGDAHCCLLVDGPQREQREGMSVMMHFLQFCPI